MILKQMTVITLSDLKWIDSDFGSSKESIDKGTVVTVYRVPSNTTREAYYIHAADFDIMGYIQCRSFSLFHAEETGDIEVCQTCGSRLENKNAE